MFDYWKKLRLVQVRQLDDLFAKELQVTSSQEEWKSKGIKFFHEHMYKMAMMCFKRAGDRDWERLAEAYGFRATADRMSGPNPEISRNYLRKAAEIFDSIDKAELAA
ncbi:hypothetical protein F0562_032401 [Nyssa sinensis]|uniref:Uncharacterized protein n=1 Tax=Nyssa sinensis TaxID=561372 RepID=A0A5J5APW1_9ASTE|nr:hypothetical protein F0562_032401 [Nyssa sinensis]